MKISVLDCGIGFENDLISSLTTRQNIAVLSTGDGYFILFCADMSQWFLEFLISFLASVVSRQPPQGIVKYDCFILNSKAPDVIQNILKVMRANSLILSYFLLHQVCQEELQKIQCSSSNYYDVQFDIMEW